MYPLKFRPILKSLVWGGEKIAPFKHIETTQHNIGESWELSGVQGNESVVANGEYAGRTISELVAQFKDRLIGKRNYARTGNEFPLLIKFIDAKQDLSIQVHPDDALAAETRLSMTVNVRFTNNTNHDEDFETRFSANRTFQNTQTLNDVQEQLVGEMIEEIVDQIFNATVANW